MAPLQDDPEPAATKRGRGRPKRVRIEEPDYKEQDEASSSVPQPDTEEDQPVSVWLAPSTPLMLGYRLLLLLLLSNEEEAVPRKLPPVIMNLLLLLPRNHDLLVM